MVRREADRARILGKVRKSQRPRVADEDAEDAAATRKLPDRRVGFRIDPVRHEALQRGSRPVDDAERRVTGAGDPCRRLDDPLEERVERELRVDGDDRLDERSQTVWLLSRCHLPIVSEPP